MKKVMFSLLLFTMIMLNIDVNAKYAEYRSGDVVMIGGAPFLVIEDSDSNSEKLKLFTSLSISNLEEVQNICFPESSIPAPKNGSFNNSLPENYIECVTEHANICIYGEEGCNYPLVLPFETRLLEDDEKLVYDENSSTNVAYFFKNKLDAYFKETLDLDDVKTRLITADEQIEYAKKDMVLAGNLMAFYGSLERECPEPSSGTPGYKILSKSASVVGIDDKAMALYGRYMVNSLKYNGFCKTIPSFLFFDSVSTSDYNELMYINPVVEINKQEFSYELTKEKEGSGNLEVNVENDIDVGDVVTINKIPYYVIENKNKQVRLLAFSQVNISNLEELENVCYIPENQFDSDELSPDELLEESNCIIEHAKYCTTISDDCEPLELPYVFDDLSDYTYNPNLENNVGHYIKNELKEVIENQLEVNVIDIDVLSYNEFNTLMDNPNLSMVLSRYIPMESIPGGNVLKSGKDTRSQPLLHIVVNYGDDLENYKDLIFDYNLILPVITVSVDDLAITAKKGDTVKIITEPEEGYELKELKVIDDDNNSVVYTPSDLVRYERGEYTFKMTSAQVHVYAKFVTIEHYDAKSMSQELSISNGLRRLSGERVRCSINLNEGDTLTKIVYYDDDNNEVEVPYELNSNGEYEFDMPDMNVFLRAVIKYADPVYNLYGKDIDIPVQKSIEGEVLTFTINGNKKVSSITYKDEDGNEIFPYFSVKNGIYSVLMPNKDVYVDIAFEEEKEEITPIPDKEEEPIETDVPITGDDVDISMHLLRIGLVLFICCVVFLKRINQKRKKVLIPYDMV